MSLIIPGGMEWVWIAIIIGILLFGAKKIPELARSMGRAGSEFKKGLKEGETGAPLSKEQVIEKGSKADLVKIAGQLGISTEGKSEEQLREEIKNTL